MWWIFLFFSSFLFGSDQVYRVPLHSFPFLSEQRFVEFEIEGKNYLALIDTGSPFSTARKDLLSQIIHKTHLSNSEYMGISGKRYMTSNFKIPEMAIGPFLFESILKEEDENFWTEGCSIQPHSFIASYKIHLMYQVFREAVLGIDLFKKFACLFDFPHSSLYLSTHISQLIQDPYPFCVVPFEIGKGGVVLACSTDLGEKKLLLDSAATQSLIRLSTSEKRYTTRLQMGETDFGSWEFIPACITTEMDEIDGILGIDFFKKNIIGLDFESQMAYIYTPTLGSKERFTYWLKGYFGQ